jgi:tetratricopeptide (TPR) repeat protein
VGWGILTLDMQGDLSDLSATPLAETLRRLSTDQRSGDLKVTSDDGVKIVFFDTGRLVFAASDQRQDRLGEALVDIGRISEREYEAASMLMRLRHQRFGEALVQSGVMDKNELGRSVAKQVKRIVLSLFTIKDGSAQFDERPCSIPTDYMVNLSLHRVLYEGIRRMGSDELVIRGLGDLSRKVALADVPPFRFSVAACSAEERAILERCRERPTSLMRLVDASGGLTLSVLRAAFALVASGVLRLEGQEDQPQPVIQADEEGFLLSSLQRRQEDGERVAQRKAIVAELARSADDDWLALPAGTPPRHARRHVKQKLDQFADMLEQVADDDALRTNVELILGRAYALLRPIEKEIAAVSTAEPEEAPYPEEPRLAAPPDEETTSGNGPGEELNDLEMEALTAGEDEPAGTPVHEQEAATGGYEVDAPPAREPEPEPPSDIPSSTEPEIGIVPIGESIAAPRPKPKKPEKPDAESVDHLLTWGNIQLTISDYASAVRTFAKLVDQAPNVASHHLRLATAMALWPQTAKQAEREFHEAIRLDANNADTRYQLAIYYKTMKLRARALEQLRLALSINPGHARARQELETLSPKDSALTSLKKLFR